MREDNEPVNQ